MKILLFILLSLFILNGCESYKRHSYLGESPSIAKKYFDKIDNLHKELLSTTDTEKGSKILNQIAKLKAEADEELKNYFSSFKMSVTIPFSQEVNYDIYKIQSIEVEKIRFNEIEMKAVITSKIDSKNPVFTYLRFVDEKGKELPGWVLFLSPFDVRKEQTYSTSGTYKGLHHLLNADRLIVKSAKDFENNLSFNN